MIEFKHKSQLCVGDILYMEVMIPVVRDKHFYILVEVSNIRIQEEGIRVEVSPVAGDRSCVWVDSQRLYEKKDTK